MYEFLRIVCFYDLEHSVSTNKISRVFENNFFFSSNVLAFLKTTVGSRVELWVHIYLLGVGQLDLD